MRILIVYDNNAKPGFKSGWGFSCLIEPDNKIDSNKKILFDTGDNPDKLLFNLNKIGINPKDIDILIISHEHWDHAGGMPGILKVNPDIKVIMPGAFSGLTEVEAGLGVYTTGPLLSSVVEQSLIVKTRKGSIVITGCAHPGIRRILKVAYKLGRIHGIIGGFHGFSDYEVLKDIELIAPCHCTQHIREIKKRFPENYKELIAGSVIEI